MLKSLLNIEKNELLNKMPFYDFNNFSCINGEEIIIELKKTFGSARYGDVAYYKHSKAVSKEYNNREKILIKVLLSIFNFYKEKTIFIIRYEDSWINNKKISPKLNKLLIENAIEDGADALQTDDINIIELLCKSIFKGNTSAYFVLKESQIVITPTDHLDIFVANSQNIKNSIKGILRSSFKNNIFVLKKV